MQVRVTKEPEADWERYLAEYPGSCLSHDPRWGKVFHSVFGHAPFYLQAEEAGRVEGVLPLVTMSRGLLGRIAVSMPYLNHGGICAASPATRDALMERATELAREVGAHWLELRHEAAVDWPLAVRQHKVSMRLALPPDPEDLFRSFSTKHRTRIRRAKKEKMTVRFGKLEEVDSFYRVFCRNMRDLGTPVYPRRFFEKLTEVFSERTHILTVYDGSSPVASGLVMGFKDRLEIPWASSIREYNHLRVNILLYWAVLEYACKQGYRVFDFGRTTPGSGTYDFKEQWGAKPMPLYWYYWLAPGQRVPDMSPQNPKYQLAIRLWQKLPLGLTNAIGPVISKHLP